MCVALPGIVEAVEGNIVTVDFHGSKVQAHGGLVEVKPGDRALVHAGCVLQVLSETESEEIEELLKEIENPV